MDRTVRREEKAPAFQLTLTEVQLLVNQLHKDVFNSSDAVKTSFTVERDRERLIFTDIDELKNYDGFDARELKFSLNIRTNENSLTLVSQRLLSAYPVVTAEGVSEAWCGGALDAAISALNRRKLWYSTYIQPKNVISALSILFFVFVWYTEHIKPNKLSSTAGYYVLLVLGVFVFITSFRERIFPAAVLSVSNAENIVKRNASEIAAIGALLSAVASFVGLYLAK